MAFDVSSIFIGSSYIVFNIVIIKREIEKNMTKKLIGIEEKKLRAVEEC